MVQRISNQSKQPVIAVQFTGHNDKECLAFCPRASDPSTTRACLIVQTAQGERTVHPGFWIVCYPGDSFEVVSAEAFESNFSLLPEDAQALLQQTSQRVSSGPALDPSGQVVGFTCKHVGLAFITALFARQHPDKSWEVRQGFSIFGSVQDEASMESNPFLPSFRDNYVSGKGSTLAAALADFEKEVQSTSESMHV